MSSEYPKKIYLFAGKRKSGKDYVTDHLVKSLNLCDVALIRISGPVKTEYGREFGLDVDELFTSSQYKELYRTEMVAWSEKARKQDYGRFCRASLDMYEAFSKPYWIVSDVRRKTDIRWFNEHFPGKIKTFKIIASEQKRVERGWTFTEGIDDAETECDLDDVDQWDRVIVNDGQNLSETIADIAAELVS